MGLASFIDDVKAEIEKIEVEREKSENDMVIKRMFEDDAAQDAGGGRNSG